MRKVSPLPVFTSLDVLLADLQQNGVTDVVAETSLSFYDFKNAAANPAAAPARTPARTATPANSSAPAPAQAKILPFVQPEQHTQKLAQVAEQVQEIMDSAPTVVGNIATHAALVPLAEDGQTVFNKKEQILWENMLKAIGLNAEDVGLITLPAGTANHSQALAKILAEHGTQHMLVLGQKSVKSLWGNATTLLAARTEEKLAPQQPNTKIQATYHPTTLLAQPLLKKLAWADLQNYKKGITTSC